MHSETFQKLGDAAYFLNQSLFFICTELNLFQEPDAESIRELMAMINIEIFSNLKLSLESQISLVPFGSVRVKESHERRVLYTQVQCTMNN